MKDHDLREEETSARPLEREPREDSAPSPSGVQLTDLLIVAGGAVRANTALRLQRTIGNQAVQRRLRPTNPSETNAPTEPQAAGVREALRTPGEALPAELGAAMGERFDHDFSGVRVHTGGAAASSAQALSADAYTLGSDVVFAEGLYSPHTGAGRELIAHELAHVVQQRGAAPSSLDAIEIDPHDSASEREADSAVRDIESASPSRAAAAGGQSPDAARADLPAVSPRLQLRRSSAQPAPPPRPKPIRAAAPNIKKVSWNRLSDAQALAIAEPTYKLLSTPVEASNWPDLIDALLAVPGWVPIPGQVQGLGGQWELTLGGAELYYQQSKGAVDDDGGRLPLTSEGKLGDRNFRPELPLKIKVGDTPVDVTIYNLKDKRGNLLDPYERDEDDKTPDKAEYEKRAKALRDKADRGKAELSDFRTVEVTSGVVPQSYLDHGIATPQGSKVTRLGRLGVIVNPSNRVATHVQVNDYKGSKDVKKAGEVSYGTLDALNPEGVPGSDRRFRFTSSPFDESTRALGVLLFGGSESFYKKDGEVTQTTDDDVGEAAVKAGEEHIGKVKTFLVERLTTNRNVGVTSAALEAVRRYALTGSLDAAAPTPATQATPAAPASVSAPPAAPASDE